MPLPEPSRRNCTPTSRAIETRQSDGVKSIWHLCLTRKQSKSSLMPPSGQAFGAKKAIRRESHWRSSRRRRPGTRSFSNGFCRSLRARLRGWRPPSKALGFIWVFGATRTGCPSGGQPAPFRFCASCSKWRRPACWWSSITAAKKRASSSMLRCSKAIKSKWWTSAPPAALSARRC